MITIRVLYRSGADWIGWPSGRSFRIEIYLWPLSISLQMARHVRTAGWPVTQSAPEVGTYIL